MRRISIIHSDIGAIPQHTDRNTTVTDCLEIIIIINRLFCAKGYSTIVCVSVFACVCAPLQVTSSHGDTLTQTNEHTNAQRWMASLRQSSRIVPWRTFIRCVGWLRCFLAQYVFLYSPYIYFGTVLCRIVVDVTKCTINQSTQCK